jgi:hypothetical protein
MIAAASDCFVKSTGKQVKVKVSENGGKVRSIKANEFYNRLNSVFLSRIQRAGFPAFFDRQMREMNAKEGRRKSSQGQS